MKTDPIFYRLFQTFPSSFFELICRSPTERSHMNFGRQQLNRKLFVLIALKIRMPVFPCWDWTPC
ncbi:MAG: DUF2887 domain-containing protein [Acaryochloridaceae cyanobacterium CSU_3_4]|nr:DUF2887 domain-containing protein [Acaryochloridaceae cyanobacterium CSU_3_4]